MIKLIKNWFNKNFSNPQAATLTLVIALVAILIYLFGNILSPVFAAIITAYLLNSIIVKLTRFTNKKVLLPLVFTLFIAFIVFILLAVVPAVMNQLNKFVANIPSYLQQVQDQLTESTIKYPDFFKSDIFASITKKFSLMVTDFSQSLVSQAFSILPNLFTAIIYLIIVPMLAWFLLNDKEKMMSALAKLVPNNNNLTQKVWHEADIKFGNYIWGKIIEIVVVGSITYLGFLIFDLQFALLLAVLVGFSVLIPYIGATVVSVPVILVSYTQFGTNNDFAYVLITFFVLQALDAYVLVPILFARAINMHPVAIIVAILFFGGLWGFWGLFFAIPLAVLIQAVVLVWPSNNN